MKRARSIELYDSGILIGFDGIFEEYGQLSTFDIDGDDLKSLASIFDIPYGPLSELRYSPKEQKDVVRTSHLKDMIFSIHHRLRQFGYGDVAKLEIWADVLSAQLLEILLVYSDGNRSKITYSGRFAVEWEDES